MSLRHIHLTFITLIKQVQEEAIRKLNKLGGEIANNSTHCLESNSIQIILKIMRLE